MSFTFVARPLYEDLCTDGRESAFALYIYVRPTPLPILFLWVRL
jgi:hypothetical protein